MPRKPRSEEQREKALETVLEGMGNGHIVSTGDIINKPNFDYTHDGQGREWGHALKPKERRAVRDLDVGVTRGGSFLVQELEERLKQNLDKDRGR